MGPRPREASETATASSGSAAKAAQRGACFPQSLPGGAVALFIGGDPPATCRAQEGRTSNRVSQTVIPERDARPLTTTAFPRGLAAASSAAGFVLGGRRPGNRSGTGTGISPVLPCFLLRLCRSSPLAFGLLPGAARATAGTVSGQEADEDLCRGFLSRRSCRAGACKAAGERPLTCQASRRPTLK